MASDPTEPKEPTEYRGWVDQLKGMIRVLMESNNDLRRLLKDAQDRNQQLLVKNSELREREVALEQIIGARPKAEDIEAVERVLAFWKKSGKHITPTFTDHG